MKQNEASQTDWARVLREIDEDAPIPYDDEDRAEGLYDPNNEAEVDEFFQNATVNYPDGTRKKLHAKGEVSLQLSEDVLAYYHAKGGDWQAAIDEPLRRLMNTDDVIRLLAAPGLLISPSSVGVTLTGRSGTVQITSKGQVTIPQAIRGQFGLLPHTEVEWEIVDGRASVRKAAPTGGMSSRARRAIELLWGSASTSMTIDKIMALTRGPFDDIAPKRKKR